VSHLILLRHGQSEWDEKNLFTGWMNAGLTAAGEEEAVAAGRMLAGHGLLPSVAHTSLLRRTIGTASLLLAAVDRDWIPVQRSWRLNGRHYGALQGMDKEQAIAEFGERQVQLWRRSFKSAPPPAPDRMHRELFDDPRYAMLPPDARPCAESLRDVTQRLLPYWYDAIVPDLLAQGSVLVVSHGNTLRALVKYLDRIPDEKVDELEIPNGVPLAYELDANLCPLGGRALPHCVVAAQQRIQARRTTAGELADVVHQRGELGAAGRPDVRRDRQRAYRSAQLRLPVADGEEPRHPGEDDPQRRRRHGDT
jgi:2,3-bisphosphoglycerate-dependent phosphoglycerate mutase